MDDREFLQAFMEYQRAPEKFTSSQEYELMLEAAKRGLPFRPRLPLVDYVPQPERSLLEKVASVPAQVVLGALEGATTIPLPAAKPESMTEAIARSVGHAIGFLYPGGVPARVARATSKQFDRLLVRAIGDGLEKIALSSTTRKVLTGMAREATALSAASAVMEWPRLWHEGVDALFEAAAMGAVYGASFNLLRYIPDIAGWGRARALARVLATSAFTALPSYLRDQTTPEKIFHHILGAYFGLHGRPARMNVRDYATQSLVQGVISSIHETASRDPAAWKKILYFLGDFELNPRIVKNRPVVVTPDGKHVAVTRIDEQGRFFGTVLDRVREEVDGRIVYRYTDREIEIPREIRANGYRLHASGSVLRPDGTLVTSTMSRILDKPEWFSDVLEHIKPAGGEAYRVLREKMKVLDRESLGLHAGKVIVRSEKTGELLYPVYDKDTRTLVAHRVFRSNIRDPETGDLMEWVVDFDPATAVPVIHKTLGDRFEVVEWVDPRQRLTVSPAGVEYLRQYVARSILEEAGGTDIEPVKPEEAEGFKLPEFKESYGLDDIKNLVDEVRTLHKESNINEHVQQGNTEFRLIQAWRDMPTPVRNAILEQARNAKNEIDFFGRTLEILKENRNIDPVLVDHPLYFFRIYHNARRIPWTSKELAETVVPRIRSYRGMTLGVDLLPLDQAESMARRRGVLLETRRHKSMLEDIQERDKEVRFITWKYTVDGRGDIRRPQELSYDDVVAADEAIRSKLNAVLIGAVPRSKGVEFIYARKLKPEVAQREFDEFVEHWRRAYGEDISGVEGIDPVSIGTLHRALKRMYGDDYLSSGRFADYNDVLKRLQMMTTRHPRLSRDAMRELEELNHPGVVVRDDKIYLRFRVGKDEGSATDGLVYIDPTVGSVIARYGGMSFGSGASKTAYVMSVEGGPTIISKHSEQVPPGPVLEQLREQGFVGQIHPSALKGIKGKEGPIYREGDEILIDAEKIYVLPGKTTPPAHGWKARVPRQFVYLLPVDQKQIQARVERLVQEFRQIRDNPQKLLELIKEANVLENERLENLLGEDVPPEYLEAVTPGELVMGLIGNTHAIRWDPLASSVLSSLVRNRIAQHLLGGESPGGVAVLGDGLDSSVFRRYAFKNIGEKFGTTADGLEKLIDSYGVPRDNLLVLDAGWRDMPLREVLGNLHVAVYRKGKKPRLVSAKKLLQDKGASVREFRKKNLGDLYDFLVEAGKRDDALYLIKVVGMRSPISTSYDFQALDLLGFTGEDLPFYRAHITNAMMHTFGGADLDIDTATLLFGLDRGVLNEVVKRTGGLTRQLGKLDDVLAQVTTGERPNWALESERLRHSYSVARTQSMIGYIMATSRNVRAFLKLKYGKDYLKAEKAVDMLTAVFQRLVLDSAKYGVSFEMDELRQMYGLLAWRAVVDPKFRKIAEQIQDHPDILKQIIHEKKGSEVIKNTLDLVDRHYGGKIDQAKVPVEDPVPYYFDVVYGSLYESLRNLHNVWMSRNLREGRKYTLLEALSAASAFRLDVAREKIPEENIPEYLKRLADPKFLTTALDFTAISDVEKVPARIKELKKAANVYPDIQDMSAGSEYFRQIMGKYPNMDAVVEKSTQVADIAGQKGFVAASEYFNEDNLGVVARNLRRFKGPKTPANWGRVGEMVHRALHELKAYRYGDKWMTEILNSSSVLLDYEGFVALRTGELEGRGSDVKPVLTRIISGGQTGADQAALELAKELGLETGGWAPKGYRTEKGPDPELGKKYGLQEHESPNYRARTEKNIEESDATVVFGNISDPSVRLTVRLARNMGKPVLVNPDPLTLRQFLIRHQVKILNVTGNRESVNRQIGEQVKNTLREVLEGRPVRPDSWYERFNARTAAQQAAVRRFVADRDWLRYAMEALERQVPDPRERARLMYDLSLRVLVEARNRARNATNNFLRAAIFEKLKRDDYYAVLREQEMNAVQAMVNAIKVADRRFREAAAADRRQEAEGWRNVLSELEKSLENYVSRDRKLKEFASLSFLGTVHIRGDKLKGGLAEIRKQDPRAADLVQTALSELKSEDLWLSSLWRDDRWFDPVVARRFFTVYRDAGSALLYQTPETREAAYYVMPAKDQVLDALTNPEYVRVVIPSALEYEAVPMSKELRNEWVGLLDRLNELGPYYVSAVDYTARVLYGRPITEMTEPEIRYLIRIMRETVEGKKPSALDLVILKKGVLFALPPDVARDFFKKMLHGKLDTGLLFKQMGRVVSPEAIYPIGDPITMLHQVHSHIFRLQEVMNSRVERDLQPFLKRLTRPRYHTGVEFSYETTQRLQKVATYLYESGIRFVKRGNNYVLEEPDLAHIKNLWTKEADVLAIRRLETSLNIYKRLLRRLESGDLRARDEINYIGRYQEFLSAAGFHWEQSLRKDNIYMPRVFQKLIKVLEAREKTGAISPGERDLLNRIRKNPPDLSRYVTPLRKHYVHHIWTDVGSFERSLVDTFRGIMDHLKDTRRLERELDVAGNRVKLRPNPELVQRLRQRAERIAEILRVLGYDVSIGEKGEYKLEKVSKPRKSVREIMDIVSGRAEDFAMNDLLYPRRGGWQMRRELHLTGYDVSPEAIVDSVKLRWKRAFQNYGGYVALTRYANMHEKVMKADYRDYEGNKAPWAGRIFDKYLMAQIYQIMGRPVPEWVLGKWSDYWFARKATQIQNKAAKYLGLEPKVYTPYDVARWSMLEGAYQLMSKLASLRFVVSNIFGGMMLTYQRSPGLRAVFDGVRAYTKNEWPEDIVAMYPALAKEGMSPHDVVTEAGLAASFYASELQAQTVRKSPEIRRFIEAYQKNKKQGVSEAEALRRAWKESGNPDLLAYLGTLSIRKPEKMLRFSSFLTGYMQALRMGFTHEEAMAFGRRFVERTQFFYDAPYRMPIANTALGRIFFRFRLWTIQNLRTQKQYLEEAAKLGFKPGTAAYERFERALVTNLMMIALATAFAFTVFDAALPAPFSWVQDLSVLVFGDEEDRKRAFWGTYGLSEITPPILSLPVDVLIGLINADFSKIKNYSLWAMFPFGRIARDLYNSIDEPHMFLDRLTGLPIHRMAWYRRDVIGTYWPQL